MSFFVHVLLIALVFILGVKTGYVVALYRVLRDLHDG